MTNETTKTFIVKARKKDNRQDVIKFLITETGINDHTLYSTAYRRAKVLLGRDTTLEVLTDDNKVAFKKIKRNEYEAESASWVDEPNHLKMTNENFKERMARADERDAELAADIAKTEKKIKILEVAGVAITIIFVIYQIGVVYYLSK